MKAEGKMKTGKTASGPGKKSRTALNASPEEPDANLILVYIDLDPLASTSVVDAYLSSITERNEQDHSVVAWADANTLDTLASLDAVSNVRAAEPSVTKESPVYHDTKFVNKRAGLSPLTADDAKGSVREFEKAPGMALEQKRTMKTSRGEAHEISSDNERYIVNSRTGNVELASYGYYSNFPAQGPGNGYSNFMKNDRNNGPISMDTGITVAGEFAAQNYPDYYNRSMVLIRSQLIDHGDAGKTYFFAWNEKVNDILTPNSVSVFVNAYNGKVLSYIGLDQPLNVDIVPSISKDTSIRKSIDRFAGISISSTKSHLAILPVDEQNQKLVWVTNVRAKSSDGFTQGGDVIIDAHSGAIIEVDRYD